MLPYNTPIFSILQTRNPDWFLDGYYGGTFSPDQTKFLALTYKDLDPKEEDLYLYNDYLALCDGGCSIVGHDVERTKIYLENGCYQTKPLEDCIREGIYQAYSILFLAVFYEQEWYIQPSMTFFGERMDEAAARFYVPQISR